MSDDPRQAARARPGRIVLIGALATGLAILNMSIGSEAPSRAVMALQYVFIAGGLGALVGGFLLMASGK
jgi:hypothetical protein